MCTRCCWAGTALAVAAAGALQLRRLLQPRPGQGPGGTLLFKGNDFAATDDLPVLKLMSPRNATLSHCRV